MAQEQPNFVGESMCVPGDGYLAHIPVTRRLMPRCPTDGAPFWLEASQKITIGKSGLNTKRIAFKTTRCARFFGNQVDRKNLYRSRLSTILSGASALSCAIALAGCNVFMPVGVSASAPRRGPSIASFPEHFVYRIDDHRYVTIQGNARCQGRLYYYDTQAGIRASVGPTGPNDAGNFSGYYAAQSPYIAIPSIGYSQISGPLLYINYSHDGGRTFKRFLAGGDFGDQNVVILSEKNLYVGLRDSNLTEDITQTTVVDISHDITIGDDHYAIRSEALEIAPNHVPTKLTSPSGETRWICSSLPYD